MRRALPVLAVLSVVALAAACAPAGSDGPEEQGPPEEWDRTGDLSRITVPTLVIGAEHDTMDPEHMRWMAEQLPDGRYLYCPDGSHLAMYDDQATYFRGLIEFLKRVD